MRRRHAYLVIGVGLGVISLAACGATLERLFADPARRPGYDVAVGGGFAYVGGNDGVAVYDIRDPEDTRLVLEPDWAGGGVFGLWLEGSTLYVASPPQGLLIFDVADPTSPVRLGHHPEGVGDVFVHRGLAYVGSYGTNLRVLDVSDPASPIEIEEFGWTNPNGAAASGDYVYVTDPMRGIVTLDVSDPTSPVERGLLPDSGSGYRLEADGDWLIAAMYSRGLRVYRLDNPQWPRLQHTIFDSGEAWDASGEYPIVCVGDLQEGLEILDVSAPYGQRDIASDDSVAPHALEYADGYVHLADQDEGYVLYRLTLDP